MVKSSNNPEQAFKQIVQSNPEFSNVVNTINTLGDPQKTFYALAKKQGVDPNTIINMLK
jgi:hypothetical protein